MIKFIKGYDNKSSRINEWNVDDSIVKTTFKQGLIHVIEGNPSIENIKEMQKMVDESVRISEGY